MGEEWKVIPNYEKYQVSNLGRIKSLNYNHKKESKIMKFRGHNKTTGFRVGLWNENGNKDFLVARLVAFTFLEEDINNHFLTVNHIDGNRFNNCLDNLELISLKENIQHGFRTGLYSKVQKKVKLTNKETGVVAYPSSLSKGSIIMGKNSGYLSAKIIKNIYENKYYKWEMIK